MRYQLLNRESHTLSSLIATSQFQQRQRLTSGKFGTDERVNLSAEGESESSFERKAHRSVNESLSDLNFLSRQPEKKTTLIKLPRDFVVNEKDSPSFDAKFSLACICDYS